MQEKYVYEYAILRVFPKVERGEFMNVGVVLYCKKAAFLQTRIAVNEKRLLALFPEADSTEINDHLCAFEQICLGNAQAGTIALLDISARFRWLTAKRSTVIQVSEIHPGLCTDPAETLEKLFGQMVG